MSAWTKFATQFFHNKQKQNPDYKFSQALKEASKVYKKTKGGSSKKQRGGRPDGKKKTVDGVEVDCEENDEDEQCQETPAPAAEVTATATEADKAVDPKTNLDTVSAATAKIDEQQIKAATGNPKMSTATPIVITDGKPDDESSTTMGGKKSKRKSKKAGKKSQKKQKKAKKAGSKKSKK
jgi:hypothetical protein